MWGGWKKDGAEDKKVNVNMMQYPSRIMRDDGIP